jgi:NDP-sugar pyrophosphorylase family protein
VSRFLVPTPDLAAVVLAAGAGRRLRPLTTIQPKPLCPIANVPLIELAFAEVTTWIGPPTADRVAVNAHHLADQVIAWVADRAHVSVEQPIALGTAGALGQLRGWLDGRSALVRNTDVWRRGPVPASFVAEWDGVRPRLLVVRDAPRADFDGGWRYAGLSLLPWTIAHTIPAEPAGLYEAVWRAAERDGQLDLVSSEAEFIDCGTPTNYLRANLAASGGASVIGPGAVVEGELVRSVVWPDGVVRRDERLVECIRVGTDLTVPAGGLSDDVPRDRDR